MTLKGTFAAVAALFLAGVTVLAPGCRRAEEPGEGVGEQPPAPPEKILVGVLLPLTGERKADGEAMLAGLKLAFEKKDAGLDELLIRDYGDALTDVHGLARDLVEIQQVSVLVGPMAAGGVEAIEELARQRQVVVLTPSAAPMKLNIIGSTVRRLTFSDSEEGLAMAELVVKKLYKSVAILTDIDLPASERRAESFRKRFEELGGRVSTQISYNGDAKDFRRVVRMAAYRKPDVFYLPGTRAAGGAIVEEMKTQSVFAAVFGSSDWGANAAFPAEVGPGAGVFAPARFAAETTNVVTIDFVKRFGEKTGRTPGSFEALGYDAGLAILDVLSRARKPADVVAEFAGVKLLSGVTGALAARRWSLATELNVMRLKGRQFEFEATVPLK